MKSIAGPHDHAVIRRFSVIAGLGLLLFAGAGLALTIGPYPVPVTQVVTELLMPSGGMGEIVIWNIRLPRVLAAMLVGAALASAGASYQILFRNPLVSPDILGVSSGAALGAVIGIFLSLPVIAIQGFAFLGGLGAVALVIFISRAVRGVDQTLVLVLTEKAEFERRGGDLAARQADWEALASRVGGEAVLLNSDQPDAAAIAEVVSRRQQSGSDV